VGSSYQNCGQGSAQDHAGGAYNAPTELLAELQGKGKKRRKGRGKGQGQVGRRGRESKGKGRGCPFLPPK